MKLRITKSVLIDAVTQVSKAVSQKTTVPILTGIKAVLDEQGLSLTGSNSDMTIQVFIPQKLEDQEQIFVEQPGSTVLPGRIFADIVRKLPGESVEWEVSADQQIRISSEQATFDLIGLDAAEFPSLPRISTQQSFSIHADLLRTMIRQTEFATSADEAKMVLTGVCLQLQNGQLTLIATDGHRLAKRQAEIEGSSDLTLENIVVPGKSMSELAKTIADLDEYVDMIVADNQLLVKTTYTRFYTRLIEGKYPETSDFIPKDGETEVISKTRELIHSVDRALLINRASHDHVIKWSIKNETVEMTSASQEIGKITEEVDAQVVGPSMTISFNPKYMIDALRSVDSEEVLIQFKGTMAPFTIKPKEHQDTLYLILPIRTH